MGKFMVRDWSVLKVYRLGMLLRKTLSGCLDKFRILVKLSWNVGNQSNWTNSVNYVDCKNDPFCCFSNISLVIRWCFFYNKMLRVYFLVWVCSVKAPSYMVCACVCLFTAKMSAADLPWFAGVPSLPALYREWEPDVSSHDGC